MGKLLRGGLWVTFWPAGLVASSRAGKRKRHAEVLETIRATAPQPSSPHPAVAPGTLKDVADRFRAAGMKNGRKRIQATAAAMDLVKAGASPEQAVAEVMARVKT